MPTIAVEGPYRLNVYFNDHPPPHCHVFWGDKEALVKLSTAPHRNVPIRAVLVAPCCVATPRQLSRVAFVVAPCPAQRFLAQLVTFLCCAVLSDQGHLEGRHLPAKGRKAVAKHIGALRDAWQKFNGGS